MEQHTPAIPSRMAPPTHLRSWNAHLATFRQDHPSLDLKTCMKQASATYRACGYSNEKMTTKKNTNGKRKKKKM